jgi:23S rRNA pseudouridine2605 synthase
MTRINKYLADCGIASRRSAEALIRAGKVIVNDQIVTDLSTQINPTDIVTVDGKQIHCQLEKVYIILNKPRGVVTTCKDQFGRKTVLDVISSETKQPRLFPVGRLDYATEGLLILTNDGEFAKKITHPSSEIPKTYTVTTNKPINQSQLKLLGLGAGFNPPKHIKTENLTTELTITEGRNRQVRKMFEYIGLRVTNLKRIAIGKLTLGNLQPGEWRSITKNDLPFQE